MKILNIYEIEYEQTMSSEDGDPTSREDVIACEGDAGDAIAAFKVAKIGSEETYTDDVTGNTVTEKVISITISSIRQIHSDVIAL